jgi:predicted nucleotidyltransferase
MLIATKLSETLGQRLPDAFRILAASNLSVHPAVYRVVLTGSRGLRGGYRPDSDIDLSLLVDSERLPRATERGMFLREVVDFTLGRWSSEVELDTVAVFDRSSCGLRCFSWTEFEPGSCPTEAPDCVGLYKTQKGFDGFVPPIGLRIRNVYPMIEVWPGT